MNHKKPNLLFVFTDQQRWCDLGCYGSKEVISPNLDRFAETAAVVDCCISNSPLCVPVRGTILTGYMPNRHRAATNDLPIRRDITAISNILEENNYHTGYIGKWHLTGIPRDQSVPRENRFGFSEWKVNNCNHNYFDWGYYDEDNHYHQEDTYEPVKLTDLALDFLSRSKNQDNPFALYLSWSTPHNPYHLMPEKYLDLYNDKNVTLRKNVQDTMDMLHALPNHKLGTKEYGRDFIEDIYRGYYGHITALDEQFGRLADYLDDNGLSEDTIVVFTSDHGDMLGSHRFIDKQLPYDESVRVPLIVRWKGKTVKGYLNEIASLVDMPETLLSMMGLSFPEKRDGVDLSPMFLENKPGLDNAYIASHVPCHNASVRPYDAWRALRSKDYLYAREAHTDCTFLFDIKNDPYQLNNLKDDVKYKDIISALKSQLDIKAKSYDDAVLDWKEFIVNNNLIDEWNKSQEYFGLPLFETGKLAW